MVLDRTPRRVRQDCRVIGGVMAFSIARGVFLFGGEAMSENVGKEQLVPEILNAAERHAVDRRNGYLVATRSYMPQDLLVSGCADLNSALQGAYSVAVRCDKEAAKRGGAEVLVYDVGLGELCSLKKVV